jgi:hypothetical protein
MQDILTQKQIKEIKANEQIKNIGGTLAVLIPILALFIYYI